MSPSSFSDAQDGGGGVGNVQDAVTMVETLSQLEKSGVKMPGNFKDR